MRDFWRNGCWWLAGAALVLVVLGLAFELVGLSTTPVVSSTHAAAVERDDWLAAHALVQQVVFAGGDFPGQSIWQERERDHFHDVAALVAAGRVLLAAAAAVVLVTFLAWRGAVARRDRDQRHKANKTAACSIT